MASLILLPNLQQPYKSIKEIDLDFCIKRQYGCEKYYMIAKGNIIEDVEAMT